jgi:hypothetical protein
MEPKKEIPELVAPLRGDSIAPGFLRLVVDPAQGAEATAAMALWVEMPAFQALDDVIRMGPNWLCYVPATECVFSIWKHPDNPERLMVAYAYRVAATTFYRAIDHTYKGLFAFTPAVDETFSVTYTRKKPLPIAPF